MAKKTIHTLEEIYPESAVAAQRERYEKSAEEFRSIFGDSDQLRYFSAPGRTEVGGNHTDHNHGKVLAASVNLDVIAVVEPTDDNIITIKSEGFPEDSVDISDLSVHEDEKKFICRSYKRCCRRFQEQRSYYRRFQGLHNIKRYEGIGSFELCGI